MMSSIRRKRRQRGKRKALRKEALKTWEALTRDHTPTPDWEPSSILMPLIRRAVPTMIANELVGVQPMQIPEGMISDIDWRFKYVVEKEKTPRQRKKEKADARRERKRMEKIMQRIRKIGSGY